MYDVVVIGAGLAGLMGAAALCEAGFRPLILAKGQGATHWTSGSIDLLGYDSRSPGQPVDRPAAAIEQIAAANGSHPYALTGLPALHQALEKFQSLMAGHDYPFSGTSERNILLPTAAGALRPTALVPATMAAGSTPLVGELLVLGFRELRDFYPPLIAANLRAQGIVARGEYLAMPSTGRKLEFFPTVVARFFDDPGFRERLAAQVAAVRGGAARLAFPAVLGFDRPLEGLRDLEARCGLPVFEIPMLPPSVPGIRLWERLKRSLVAAGARLEIGAEVVRAEAEQNRISAVWTAAAGHARKVAARAFLLATGGIAGGGIVAEGDRLRESVFDLPIAGPVSTSWFGADFDGVHPVFRAGVRVDRELRPCDDERRVVYSNVAVAGGALAGADSIRERSMEGIALATGWIAGRRLAEYLTT